MRVTILAAALALSFSAHAREGMWVPQQLPEIAGPLKEAGLELPPEQLANLTGDPMGAVVALGGCTASFVSPNGLVVTNHHCAYGAIQLNSTAENNLIKNGFNAPATTDEVSAGPNARVFVLDEITDVTKDAQAAIAAAGGINVSAVLGFLQVRYIYGLKPYDRRLIRPLAVSAGISLAMALLFELTGILVPVVAFASPYTPYPLLLLERP